MIRPPPKPARPPLIPEIVAKNQALMEQLEREEQWVKDVRDERKAIVAVAKADEIIDARQRGLRWADAARLVGFRNPGSAWQLVDLVTGDARQY